MNEIANLCEQLGADVDQVRIGIGTDSRIGKRFLFAGIGYGGSCFPKDVQALEKSARDADYDFRILKSVIAVNDFQKLKLLNKLKAHYHGNLAGKTVAIWGLAFKPYTDDIREAPALINIEGLLEAGVNVRAYDPEAMENVSKIMGDKIYLGTDEYDVLEGADVLMIFTEWPEFRTPNWEKIGTSLKEKVIFDGRNLYEKELMEKMQFKYFSIGRKEIHG